MKKGFTLIELLAVIVILAIIALIATPIILGIINDARKESQERSAELYLNGVELAIARRNLTEAFNPSTCTITDGVVTCDGKELKVDVDGEVPESGTIYIENNKIKANTFLVFNTFKVEINVEGEIEVGPKEETPNNGETPDSGSTQVYKPQYYYFGYDWSGTVGTTAAPVESERLTVPPTDKNYYLGYDVEDGKVTAAYACFTRNDVEYCLKPNDYAKSIEIIKDAYSDVVDTDACSFVDDYSNCYADGLGASANSNGNVYADDASVSCYVNSDGHFVCNVI